MRATGSDAALLRSRGLPRTTVITDELRRSWARTAAQQAAKRRQHAHKAARASIRRPTA